MKTLHNIPTSDLLAELVSRNRGIRALSPERNEQARRVIADVATKHTVAPEAILEARGCESACLARDEACWRLEQAGFSHTMIMLLLRRSAPSTVFKAVRRHEKRSRTS